MAIQKELLRQIIKENDLKSAGDVYSLLKDSFKDLLQELLEAELDVSLGYDKNYPQCQVFFFTRLQRLLLLIFIQRFLRREEADTELSFKEVSKICETSLFVF